jgi:Inovirus Gp2
MNNDPSDATHNGFFLKNAICNLLFDDRSNLNKLLDYAENINQLTSFLSYIEKIKDTKMLSFSTRNSSICAIMLNPAIENSYVRFLPKYMNVSKQLPKNCNYSNDIEIFLACCNDFPVPLYKNKDAEISQSLFAEFCDNPDRFYRTTLFTDEDNKPYCVGLVSYINDFIANLNKRLSDPSARRKLLDQRKAAKKNFKKAESYIQSLFEKKKSLAVIRINLGYKKDFEITTENALKDINRLLTNRRHTGLLSGLYGYILKLEPSSHKGTHIHLMLIFDGTKLKGDETLTQNVGEYWIKHTSYSGEYWYYNESRHPYLDMVIQGIGNISVDDKDKIHNLVMAVKFMCIKDQFVKLKTNLKIKTLRTGNARTL